MLRALVLLVFSLLALAHAPAAEARCNGSDMRSAMSTPQRSALQRAAAAVPFGSGNHWIARKGDRQINVIGTMHVNDPRFSAVVRRLAPVITSADLVLFEVTRKQARAFWDNLDASSANLFLIGTGPTLDKLLPAEAWDTLWKKARNAGIAPSTAKRIKPWFLTFYLADENCSPRGLFAANGLDRRIEKLARRSRVPIGSLETVSEAILPLSRRPIRDQLRMMEFDTGSTARNETLFVTMRETYFEEASAEGDILEQRQFLSAMQGPRGEAERLWRNYRDDLLNTRNRAWLPRILGAPGQRIVVTVGAAHLPGETGVLRLLERAGYRLERAAF